MSHAAVESGELLTAQDIAFYETFGYLTLKGLFSDEIGEISSAFDQVFDDDETTKYELTDVALHGNELRTIIMGAAERHPVLDRLRTDPRVLGIVKPLLGPEAEYQQSDGNVFSCDTEWHSDTFGSPMTIRHLKVSFYLDPIRAGSGALRVMPGTNYWQSDYAIALRKALGSNVGAAENVFGVASRDLPQVVLETDPGDVVVWNYRTIHASYGGGARRRLLSINFKEHTDPT